MADTVRLFSKDEVVSTGNLETVGECATAIKAHVDTCNNNRDLQVKIAVGVIGYAVAVSIFIGTLLIGHADRLDKLELAQIADRKTMSDALQASLKEVVAVQIADRAQFQSAMAADRERMTASIAVVTNSQIERTKSAVESMNKSDSLTREELKSIREEIERLRGKVEALVIQRR